MISTRPLANTAWYKETWPWILMAGPALVIVAGVSTLILALRSENALVVDNYYKEGLAINRQLQAESEATRHRYVAHLHIASDGQLKIDLKGDTPPDGDLRATFVHPTSARFDREVTLVQDAAGTWIAPDGRFVTEFPRWSVMIGDRAGTWRLSGEWRPAVSPGIVLTAGDR